MSTATTGTGAITLGSAVSGFLSFAGAGIQDGDTVTYAIQDGTSSEIGRGVYTAAGTTLSRSVLQSTNSNNAISLSGSAQVFITPAAEDFMLFPASSVDGEIALFSGTGGRTLKRASATGLLKAVSGVSSAAVAGTDYMPAFNALCDGRLTLTSGTAVTSADVTGATTIYFTPRGGNRVALYDGSAWKVLTFTELSLALGTLSTNTNYDVFVYDNSGSVAIDTLVAWTDGTTRVTALTLQDGVLVKSGATTRRYVGTIRTTSTTTTEDSKAKRFVWNMYNRVLRVMHVVESTNSWSYSTAAWRQANNSTANQLAMVRGIDEDAVSVQAVGSAVSSTSTPRSVRTAIGLDSASSPATNCIIYPGSASDSIQGNPASFLTLSPGVGYHYLAWLEYGGGADTQTWRGDNGDATIFQTGISATVMA